MKNFIFKIKSYIVAHKLLSVVILIIILGVGYFGYKKVTSTTGDTRYITAKVEKGTIVASVTGSGQVSSSSQVDIKPKVSGDAIYIAAKDGQKIGTGGLIAELDNKNAQKSVRDAELGLQSAKIALSKLKLQNSDENLNADLVKAYEDGLNAISDTFLDLPLTINGLETIIFNNTNLSENATRASGETAQNYRKLAETAYYSTKDALDKNKLSYGKLSNTSPKVDIENVLDETYNTTKLLSDAIKNTVAFVDYMAQDSGKPSTFTSYQTTLATYSNTVDGHLTALLGAQINIKNNKDSVPSASLDIQSAELSVQQKENALQDAKDALADYFIRAPFDGTLASVNIKKSDSVSTSTVVATLITTQQLAEISLNEVDVAKIKIGQKATLTFDAIPGLTISGKVGEIDVVGTVSQGVVTYNVKISFDTEDKRVKPAMSVSAAIITDIKQDVLIVPNSAIKSQTGMSYVESFGAPLAPPTDGLIGSISKIAPNKIPVEVGLSNDSQSEIISGVTVGDEIVTRTILPGGAKPAATAPSIFGSPGGRRTGGGAL